jgi:tyrosine-protein phosphatase SIW14
MLTPDQHRTGCVTACFRKTQYIQNDPAIAEYRDYSHPKSREDDMRFIKSFDPSIVLPIAQSQGWLPTPPPEPNDGFWHLKHQTEIPTYEDVAAIKSSDEQRDQITRISVK